MTKVSAVVKIWHCLYWHNNPFEIPFKVDIEIHSHAWRQERLTLALKCPFLDRTKEMLKCVLCVLNSMSLVLSQLIFEVCIKYTVSSLKTEH